MNRRRSAFGVSAAGLVLAWPGLAYAHAFSRSSLFESFVEGAALPLTAPTILLCFAPFGLLVGLVSGDGIPKALPAFLAGLVAAVPIAPFFGPFVEPVAVFVGAICAAVAALMPNAPAKLVVALAIVAGSAGSLSALSGHAWGEVPVATQIGLVFGAYIVLAAGAGAVIKTRERWTGPALTLAWRIAASWCGAIALIYAAFESRKYF